MRRGVVAAVLVVGACSAVPRATPSTSPLTTPTTTTVTTLAPTTTTAPSSTTTTLLSTTVLGPSQFLVAESSGPLAVYQSPGDLAPMKVIEEMTVLGTPRVYLVEEGPIDGWVLLKLPVRPNGLTGWAQARDLSYRVVDHMILIDLSERSLRLLDGGERVIETRVAVGTERNPTPIGSFFVTDAIRTGNPKGPWGPFAFGLSAHSDTITEFNGGDGIIGIHGTNRPATIGTAASLGCVRVPNEIIEQLADLVELGAPVTIEE
jgi:hypothetical protein